MLYFVVALAGVAFGVFCPSLARKLKALFVKEASKGVTLAEVEVKKVESKL